MHTLKRHWQSRRYEVQSALACVLTVNEFRLWVLRVEAESKISQDAGPERDVGRATRGCWQHVCVAERWPRACNAAPLV